MPNLANAKKALRQNAKRAARNKLVKDEIHSLRRHFRKHVDAKQVDDAAKMLPLLYKKLDRSAKSGVYKVNKVSRIKSRLAAALNRAKA